ncbi:MAG: NAD(P)/FAD-dependent oxidoreductase [Tannerellaceae bacterium]
MNESYYKGGTGKPHVLILGSNIGGLTAARMIRQEVNDKVDITVVDRKPYLIFVPNIPLEILMDQDPMNLQMPFYHFLKEDKTVFLQAEVKDIDIDSKNVTIVPTERPGAASDKIRYDYLVIALGAKLDYAAIPGFAEYGHTVSDSYYGNKLRRYLFGGKYKGGPIALGTARFKQGTKGLPDWFPQMTSACEGPPLELSMGFSTLLQDKKWGTPGNITLFTQGELMAEDAGAPLAKEFLKMAVDGMGMKYVNNTVDIKEITKDGIEFVGGQSIEAELKVVLPNWNPHDLMKKLPIVDEVGFVITDLHMRNPDYPEIMAVGDSAALTAPKLGAFGDVQARIVARQIAKDLGMLKSPEDELSFDPMIVCYGDMGHHKAFYIHSNLNYGGKIGIMKMGHMYYTMKIGFKDMFFQTGAKTPGWGMNLSELIGDKL